MKWKGSYSEAYLILNLILIFLKSFQYHIVIKLIPLPSSCKQSEDDSASDKHQG